jgi:hypothetical protein
MRTPKTKQRRLQRDRERRAEGLIKSWSRERRYQTPNGHRKLLVLAARRRAKKRGLSCTIEFTDFIIPKRCPVLGIKLYPTFGGRGPKDHSPSLDRLDNRRGYVRGNIIVVSWRANRIKCDATPNELQKVARFYGQKSRKSPSATNSKSA